MAYPEPQYHKEETAKEYTRVYELNNTDKILVKQQEDGKLGYTDVSSLKGYNRNYGQFYDTTSQSGSANTAYAIKLNGTSFASGVSIVSGSRISVENTGTYNLQFSAQLDRVAGSGVKPITVWLSITGSNVDNTSTIVIMSGGAAASATVAAWNYLVPLNAGEYCELMWSTQDTNLQITASGSMSNPTRPAIPSVIATMTQVA
jgi:hypothetical protein